MPLNVESTMIKKFSNLFKKKKEVETQTTLLQKKANTYKVECAIDEEIVDCREMDNPPYIGIPAPVYLEDDSWFGPAPLRSEKQLDYMEQETIIKQQEAQETHEYKGEPCNMHQLMYEMATSNWNTVDETRESIGGSENFQTGPGGWNSGGGIVK